MTLGGVRKVPNPDGTATFEELMEFWEDVLEAEGLGVIEVPTQWVVFMEDLEEGPWEADDE